jgi:hypothetical protein
VGPGAGPRGVAVANTQEIRSTVLMRRNWALHIQDVDRAVDEERVLYAAFARARRYCRDGVPAHLGFQRVGPRAGLPGGWQHLLRLSRRERCGRGHASGALQDDPEGSEHGRGRRHRHSPDREVRWIPAFLGLPRAGLRRSRSPSRPTLALSSRAATTTPPTGSTSKGPATSSWTALRWITRAET